MVEQLHVMVITYLQQVRKYVCPVLFIDAGRYRDNMDTSTVMYK